MSDFILTYNNINYNTQETTALKFLQTNKLPIPIVVSINNTISDLTAPITTNSTVIPLYFEDAKHVFWHSSAHILGYAILNIFPDAKLSSGPPTANGFFYDVCMDPITQTDYKKIEDEFMKIVKSDYPFIKEEMTKEQLLDFYHENPYKTHFVEKINESSSVYKCGAFTDFCQGPHIRSTALVKAFKVTGHSSSYFLGKNTNASLQRIYGVSFPTRKELKEYEQRIELAKKRDHRKIGTENNLFFFNELSPGSCFFLPKGAFMYNTLISYLKEEYLKRGFSEVISPNMYSTKLWEKSGHLKNYKENMFCFEVDETLFALKPMNCPGHCLMFKSSTKSYRELPLRFADFGVLHRNELSGTLSGLTRVRRFQQDDAHIFCTTDQIEEEIQNCLMFLKDVYTIFNFKYELRLSTRPEKFIGEIQTWDEAEQNLKNALKEYKYELNEGDGAFYGPKIDIVLEDALGRKNQCATIQLDFQLPERFELSYCDSNGQLKRPVMIHRAILGSVERFLAIIIENYGVRLPLWISPWQIALISVSDDEYALSIKKKLFKYNVELFNDEGMTLNKKIRSAEIQGFCLICVVGKKEEENEEINVRNKGVFKIEDFINKFEESVRLRKEYD
ncbi:Threonine--tRNA ligase 2 [Conglomerata obtusa]